MARLYLVRHGKSAHGWDVDPDSPLSELGMEQASNWAKHMVERFDPMPIQSSPRLSTTQTGQYLAKAWGQSIFTQKLLEELPVPEGIPMEERRAWLNSFFERSWASQPSSMFQWEQDYISYLMKITQDTVVVSHYMNINRSVAAVTGSVDTVCIDPDYCSITCIDNINNSLVNIDI